MSDNIAAAGGAPLDSALEDRVSEKVAVIAEHRSVIDQAKGMLMLLHGVDADKAFELLRWRSQETNTKLHALASQVVSDFLQLSAGGLAPPNSAYDESFMTAHERLTDEDGSGT